MINEKKEVIMEKLKVLRLGDASYSVVRVEDSAEACNACALSEMCDEVAGIEAFCFDMLDSDECFKRDDE